MTFDPVIANSAINTIRFLAVDGVQKANSGHPGAPMGAAPMTYVLWNKFLRHNPGDPCLAGPRPFCPFRRPRLDAALQHVASDRL